MECQAPKSAEKPTESASGDAMAVDGEEDSSKGSEKKESKPLVAADSVPVDEAEAWPVGTRVLTIYGSGVVVAFRPSDSIYSIGLPFGTAFVPSNPSQPKCRSICSMIVTR